MELTTLESPFRARLQLLPKLTDLGDGPKLFDLANDPTEQRDRAAEEPAKLRELEADYAAWNRGNVPPAWANPEPDPRSGVAAAP